MNLEGKIGELMEFNSLFKSYLLIELIIAKSTIIFKIFIICFYFLFLRNIGNVVINIFFFFFIISIKLKTYRK